MNRTFSIGVTVQPADRSRDDFPETVHAEFSGGAASRQEPELAPKALR